MKYVIVSGCSWTSPYNPRMDRGSHYDFVKWPDHLKNMIDRDAELINLAQSGQGNEYIYTTLKNTLLEIDPKDILLVVAAWSGCMREDWVAPEMVEIQEIKQKSWRGIRPHYGSYTRYTKDFEYMIAKSNNWRWSLGGLCKQLGVKLVDFNMICNSSEESHTKDPLFGLIDPRQSISQQNGERLGLPSTISVAELLFCDRKEIRKYYWGEWEGKSKQVTSYTNPKDYEVKLDPKYRLEKHDNHPNDQGHKEIAEWIYDEIQRLGH